MKRKTLYNILMFAAIAAIAAGALLLAGRHLGWFDKVQEDAAAPASVTVCKGLSVITRSGIATELSGQTQLRDGDVLSVTSGTICLSAGNNSLLLGEGGKLTVLSAAGDTMKLTLNEGEAFCQGDANGFTLCCGDTALSVVDSILICSVRTGTQTVHLLSGSVSDGTLDITAGQTCSYVGVARDLKTLDLRALSSFSLQCALDCNQTLVCTARELQGILDERSASVEHTNPTDGVTISDPAKPNSGSTTSTPPAGTDSTPTTNDKPSSPPPSSDGKPADKEPDDPSTPAVTLRATIEIRCDTILNNMDALTPGLDVYVPANGIILPTTTVTFTDGESVYDVLKRVCDQNGIQIEASWTPVYGSYYVEGINHLYEFSCGNLSGWMYKVNGWFPNYGCSEYKLSDGDSIVWCYTCQGLGSDVGGAVW